MKAKIRNRDNPVPHPTKDTKWGNGKNTRKHKIQERKEVCLSKNAINRQENEKEKKIRKYTTKCVVYCSHEWRFNDYGDLYTSWKIVYYHYAPRSDAVSNPVVRTTLFRIHFHGPKGVLAINTLFQLIPIHQAPR